MFINRAIAVAISVLVFGFGLGAEDGKVRIGIVDVDQAIGATTGGKAAREELERKQREVELELQPMVERFQALGEEFQKKRLVLSEDKLREMELDLTELKEGIETKQSQAQARLRLDFERLITPLQQKLDRAVNAVGRDGSYSMIFVRGAPGLVYYREALDITDQIIEQVNKQEE